MVLSRKCETWDLDFSQADHSAYHILCSQDAQYIAHNVGHISGASPSRNYDGPEVRCKKDLRVRFGAYVEASHDSIVTNDLTDRTHPCISLGPLGSCRDHLSVSIF